MLNDLGSYVFFEAGGFVCEPGCCPFVYGALSVEVQLSSDLNALASESHDPLHCWIRKILMFRSLFVFVQQVCEM